MRGGHIIVPPTRSTKKSRRLIVRPALTAAFFKQ
jgi:hypothetical protein